VGILTLLKGIVHPKMKNENTEETTSPTSWMPWSSADKNLIIIFG